MELIAAISYGTSKKVNGKLLDEAVELGKKLNVAVWADHYFFDLGLVPADSGILGGEFPEQGRYVCNALNFLLLTRFIRQRHVHKVIVHHAPQIIGRVWLDAKHTVYKYCDSVTFCHNIRSEDYYDEASAHRQTRGPKRWWAYEIPLLAVATRSWKTYAKLCKLTEAELAEIGVLQ